jgi:monovalent cation/proton antiporter MnhG/PhaG subunit
MVERALTGSAARSSWRARCAVNYSARSGCCDFPDVYTRIHAASLTDTGGATLMLLGMGLCLIAVGTYADNAEAGVAGVGASSC